MALMSTTRGVSFDPAVAAQQRERDQARERRADANRAMAKQLDQQAKEARKLKRQVEAAYKERARDSRKSLPRKRGRG